MTQTQTWPDDLPDFDDPGTNIIRHSYGGASAAVVIVFMLALGLLAASLIAADRTGYFRYGSASVPFVSSLDSRMREALSAVFRTAPEDYGSVEDMELTPEQAKLKEAIDWHFRILDPNDVYKLELFLYRYESHPYAERKGYARAARQALAHLKSQADEAAERRRRNEQQTAPWDMGVQPPESFD